MRQRQLFKQLQSLLEHKLKLARAQADDAARERAGGSGSPEAGVDRLTFD